MKRLIAIIAALTVTGCASPPRSEKSSSAAVAPPPIADTTPPAEEPASKRVTLPYVFTRHGVDIRVNSIESAGGQVLVSITLLDTRGQTFDMTAATVMQVVNASGQALPYSHYKRADKDETDPIIHLAANDHFSMTLSYQQAPGASEAAGSSLELRFPTGKYWNSSGAK